MIERLSKRFGLSEKFQSQILAIIDDPTRTGEFPFGDKDDEYFGNLIIRETDFDIQLHSCNQIIEKLDS
jgi:hypothetical protein